MKSVLVSLQKTVILSANTFDHAVFTCRSILVIFCVEFEFNTQFSNTEICHVFAVSQCSNK